MDYGNYVWLDSLRNNLAPVELRPTTTRIKINLPRHHFFLNSFHEPKLGKFNDQKVQYFFSQ